MRQTAVINHSVIFLILMFSFGWTGCMVTDSTLDNPEESEVPLSTPTADIRNNAISTPHSPTITSTSLPTSTPTKKTPPTPTQIIYATDVPQSTSTAVPSPTSSTPFATPEVALVCQQGEEYTSCEDLVLGLQFEYPNQWGNLSSWLNEGGYTGYAYDYLFENGIGAGGRSRDFSEGRGGILTDFYGFSPPIEDSICFWPRYRPNTICQEIKPNVVFLVSLPNADEFCSEYSPRPLTAVALEIPHNDFINGFVFIGGALSQERLTELDNIFGPRESETWPQCDEVNKKVYNQRVREIAQEIEDSLINGEPDPSIVPLLRLAESITFK